MTIKKIKKHTIEGNGNSLQYSCLVKLDTI